MNEHCKRENTNEITCPHCDYEFGDSWESIPATGDACWTEDCPECEKTFNVSFDLHNVDNGFSTHVIDCKEGNHKYKLHDKCYKRDNKDNYYISDFSRIEVCTICDDYKFISVKHDGSDFSKQELLDFKIKKRLSKKDKVYNDFEGVKTGVIYCIGKTDITLSFKEIEGNLKIWVALCRWLMTKGYKPQRLPDYLRDRNVAFKKDWLECEVLLNNHDISIQFYQNEILRDRKKGDGRHEHHKYDLLTPSMKMKMKASIHMIKKHFIKKGFEFQPELSDHEKLLSELKIEKLSDWKDPEVIHSRNNEDRDKKPMKSGDLKYFYSCNVLKRGVIWWNNGNQWYVMVN